MGDEWISTAQAAEILGVSESTVYRSLAEDADPHPNDVYGPDGYRRKPLTRRRIMQIRRSRVVALTGDTPEV